MRLLNLIFQRKGISMKIIFAVGLTLILGIGLALNTYAAGDATKGKAAYAVCAACHGANGMGNKALNSPSIAGQEPWYLERQLNNFKAGESAVQIPKTPMACKCGPWL